MRRPAPYRLLPEPFPCWLLTPTLLCGFDRKSMLSLRAVSLGVRFVSFERGEWVCLPVAPFPLLFSICISWEPRSSDFALPLAGWTPPEPIFDPFVCGNPFGRAVCAEEFKPRKVGSLLPAAAAAAKANKVSNTIRKKWIMLRREALLLNHCFNVETLFASEVVWKNLITWKLLLNQYLSAGSRRQSTLLHSRYRNMNRV